MSQGIKLANIKKLPGYVIQMIIGYTYSPQSPTLLRDIENFSSTKKLIHTVYNQYWTIDMMEDENEYKHWIMADIEYYINDYQITLFYGYNEKMYHIFYRNLQLKTVLDVNTYWLILQKKHIHTQINILWGLLTPIERNEIISNFDRRVTNMDAIMDDDQ